MGILNTVASMAKGTAASEHAQVAGGLMDELQQRGGVGSLIQNFQRNGMGSVIEQWSQGNTQPNPTAIENGTEGTGLIDSIAQRTGLAPGVVRGGLAIALPLIVHHMVSNNHVTPNGVPTGDQPEPTSVLQSVLQRII
ncbi:YidB family protein [Occallatibacter savannae]|uniref:YidB family protein n=1 Tax=Occallatibacter savannae TaxID=1002691 RepID=UPI000D69A4C0|nr:YidB family protein [Occallatibacter savannae]